MKTLHSLRFGLLASLGLTGAGVMAADPVLEKVSVRAVAHFDFDRSTILAQDSAQLLAEVGAMKDVAWQTVTATGYTDSVGAPGYNTALGQRRAGAVTAYLKGQGLPSDLLRTRSGGASAPVADNATEQGRAQNRRTEVMFEGVRTQPR